MRDPKRKPTHPGMIIREDILPTLKLNQGKLAKHLGVSHLVLSAIIHEKRAVTAEMAKSISTTLGGSLKSWLRMQEAFDLWDAQQKLSKD